MIEKKTNYRKIYGYENIPSGWEVHHINWKFNENYDEKSNLIAVPKIVHKAIHSLGGSIMEEEAYESVEYDFDINSNLIFERQFIEYLLKIYAENKSKKDDEIFKELEKGFEQKFNKKNTKAIVSDERIKQEKEFFLAQDKFLSKHPEISDQDILKLLCVMDEDQIITLFNNYSPDEFEVMMGVYKHIFECFD